MAGSKKLIEKPAGIAFRELGKVYGRAQRVTTRVGVPTGHAMASLRAAYNIGKRSAGKIERIHFNQTIRTITGGKVNSNLRPDFAFGRKNGKIDLYEVRSPSQTLKEQQDKLREMRDSLPEGMRGEIGVVDINDPRTRN